MAAQQPSSSKGAAHSPDRATSYEHVPMQPYYTEGRRYLTIHFMLILGTLTATVELFLPHQFGLLQQLVRATLATKEEGKTIFLIVLTNSERSISGEHSPSGSMNPNWNQQGWQGQSGSVSHHYSRDF